MNWSRRAAGPALARSATATLRCCWPRVHRAGAVGLDLGIGRDEPDALARIARRSPGGRRGAGVGWRVGRRARSGSGRAGAVGSGAGFSRRPRAARQAAVVRCIAGQPAGRKRSGEAGFRIARQSGEWIGNVRVVCSAGAGSAGRTSRRRTAEPTKAAWRANTCIAATGRRIIRLDSKRPTVTGPFARWPGVARATWRRWSRRTLWPCWPPAIIRCRRGRRLTCCRFNACESDRSR